ncbi:bifunctional diguanylate cyclase/phosphodiesterase [Rhodopseudomonas sp. B29]|uniref:putative bifunctional diguanylate cyclase/phosphodiesterase n=1 Tax=Rhodopseudomonas sp. B29 TaxID=95607 RepID=UPI0027D902F2|nr:bifunctional diguanylate cyclase/phosphodiesterase [Rhodopseudomonas sp. B29]
MPSSGQQAAAATAERGRELTLAAFMNVEVALAMIGPDGTIHLSNPVFDRAFGMLPPDELQQQLQIEAWRRGGDDPGEVTLPDGRTFALRLRRLGQDCFVRAQDITDQVASLAHQAQLARTDRLTELGNRLMFCERLEALLRGDGEVSARAVLTIDLNRFKAINDTLGREIGDALLGLVAKRIRSAVTQDDVVARLDSDEFGIIQTGTGPQPETATSQAKRLVDLLSRPYLVEGQLINVGAAVGIALPGDQDTDPDVVIKNADIALNRAKQERHAGYRVFESQMDVTMRARRMLETDLRRALALREFALVYQPQFDLATRRIVGFEALLRWHSPTRGAVSPLDFIPLTEETGMIGPIGDWVLRTACREAANWPDDISVAVNISAVQFENRGLLTTIVSALAESGLEPRRLELEITESVMLDAHGTALGLLQQLRAIGVRVSLDDFGTGYSSLGYLRSFPFDKIKIDQSFVRDTNNDRSSRAIVRAIAALGHNLGMTTVAEGVETEEQMTRVTEDGCTEIQGYLISRPLPADQIGPFLANQDAAATRTAAE